MRGNRASIVVNGGVYSEEGGLPDVYIEVDGRQPCFLPDPSAAPYEM